MKFLSAFSSLRLRVSAVQIFCNVRKAIVDGSAGILQSDHPVPEQGTRFNFIEAAGFGVEFPIAERLSLRDSR